MPATTTLFLDTNVFLYAAGAPHAHREACVEVLRVAATRGLHAVCDSEVLQEILHVCARRGRRAEAVALVRRTIDACAETLSVTAEDVADAGALAASIDGLPARDAVHAAVMLHHGIRDIVSVDPDFDRVPGIRRLTPAQALRAEK